MLKSSCYSFFLSIINFKLNKKKKKEDETITTIQLNKKIIIIIIEDKIQLKYE